MESPIPPAFNRFAFNLVVGSLALGVVSSLISQKRALQTRLDPLFKALKAAKTSEDRLACWDSIHQSIWKDAREKKTGFKVALSRHLGTICSALENAEGPLGDKIISKCLTIIQIGFVSDPEGRAAFSQANGCRTLLNLLAKAHKDGNKSLKEDIAKTLEQLVVVEYDKVILPDDVPLGSECAYYVATRPAAIQMLRTLDPTGSIVYLLSVTGIFANLTTLRAGAKAIYKGTDGMTGLAYFLRLLSSSNHKSIIEHASRVVSNFVRAGLGHEEISQVENISLVADLISPNSDAKTVNAALTVIVVMLDSPHLSLFLTNFENSTNGLQSLFNVWTRHPERICRERAQVLIQCLTITIAGPTIKKLLQVNRMQIEERKEQDRAEEARQKQQMQQQQMMQQMMMQRMGGGDMAAMMGE